MPHHTHKLKAYTIYYYKPLVFCALCGREEDEGLEQPCSEKFYVTKVDTKPSEVNTKFVSGLSENF